MPQIDRRSVKLSDRLVTGGVGIATNAGVAAASYLPNNSSQIGGIEVNAIAFGVNAIVQLLKIEGWLTTTRLCMWWSVYLGGFICFLLWGDDPRKELLNTLACIGLIMIGYPMLNKTGLMKQGEMIDDSIRPSVPDSVPTRRSQYLPVGPQRSNPNS